jgi:phosphoribosylglycinamide formyltransferase-1
MTLPIAVLISGRGSNLAAILRAIDAGECAGSVCVVASDRRDALGLELARERGIATVVVRLRDHADRDAWNAALAEAVAAHAPGLVVLAGFMRVVGRPFLDRFPRRVINLHPSLLPAFPGADGPALAIAAGVRISGCTVHLVDDGVDTGPIVAQAAVPVLADDDAARLHARIQVAEHRLLPRVIDDIARGAIHLDPSVAVPMDDVSERTVLYSLPIESRRP